MLGPSCKLKKRNKTQAVSLFCVCKKIKQV